MTSLRLFGVETPGRAGSLLGIGAAHRKSVFRSLIFVFCLSGIAWSEPALGPAPIATADILKAGAAPAPERLAQGLVVDATNRAGVVEFWDTVYLASEGVPINWTGSVPSCTAGTTSAEFMQATLRRLNYYRAMTGLPGDVTLDATLSAKCQDAALIMIANGSLSHQPPNTWTCWTQNGADAASKSNLAIGVYGPDAIDLYISDPGAGNSAVGHRRWILYPPLINTGTGSTNAVNSFYHGSDALWVIGLMGSRPSTPEWVAWPPAGYVPYPLVYGRWSFSYYQADFDNATVTMTRDGSPISVTLEPVDNRGFGDRTLVWVPDVPVGSRPTQDTTYTVTIQNVVINSGATEFQYQVTVIDPDAPPPTLTPTPTPAPVAVSGLVVR